MAIEYICLNPKCRQIQMIDEIHDGESEELYCSYCYGTDFFEREADLFDPMEDTQIMELAERRITELSRAR